MNYYSQAIDVLEKLKCATNDQYRTLLIEIAKKHPKLLVEAADMTNVISTSWKIHAKDLVSSGQKISAIRLVRNNTGISLKAAKEFVEAL
jgi:ribosomal protein L7/L12